MDKCPQCGYTEAQVQHMKSNVMNHYVNSLTGKPDGIYNSEEINITIKGVKLTLQSKWIAPAPKAVVVTTSVKPPAPLVVTQPTPVVVTTVSSAPVVSNVTNPPVAS